MASNTPKIKPEGHNRNWAPPLQELHNAPPVQTKLEIGEPGDKYEQEADKMADKVMMAPYDRSNMVMMAPNPGNPMLRTMPMRKKNTVMMAGNPDNPTIRMKDQVQKNEMKGEDDELQMKPEERSELIQPKPTIQKTSDGTSHASAVLTANINSTKGQGSKLPESIQAEMGSKMGSDFSGIKVHNNTHATEMNNALGAKAFTHGNDIYFNKGEYSPSSQSGKHLLAHELTHTIQQGTQISPKIQKADKKVYMYEVYTTSGKKSDAVTEDQIKSTVEYKDYLKYWASAGMDEATALDACNRILAKFDKGIRGREANYIASGREALNAKGGAKAVAKKTVTINVTHLHGSTGNISNAISDSNSIVYKQADVVLKKGTEMTINEVDSKKVIGNDLILDEYPAPSRPTNEEKALFKLNQSKGAITMYFVKAQSMSNSGEAFWPALGHGFVGFVNANIANSRSFAHELGHVLLDDGGHAVPDDTYLMWGAKSSTKYKLSTTEIANIRSSPYAT